MSLQSELKEGVLYFCICLLPLFLCLCFFLSHILDISAAFKVQLNICKALLRHQQQQGILITVAEVSVHPLTPDTNLECSKQNVTPPPKKETEKQNLQYFHINKSLLHNTVESYTQFVKVFAYDAQTLALGENLHLCVL